MCGVKRQRHIAPDGDQVFGEHHLLAVGLDFLAEFAFYFVQMFVNSLDCSVVFYQSDGRLLPYSRAAGNVVRGVAHQSQDVDYL